MRFTVPVRLAFERGYIMILTLVVLIVGAGAWFASGSMNLASKRSFEVQEANSQKLNKIKQSLLTFSVLVPEIYQNDSVSPPPPLTSEYLVPGPGYLPCWDTNGDGAMDCSFTTGDYHPHYLPQSISLRHLFFGDYPKHYYYVLDQKWAIQNSNYNNGSTKRYAPLNSSLAPELRLNDDGRKYVALIIYTGTTSYKEVPLDSVNNDGDVNFYSKSILNPSVKDQIVGITATEWNSLVKRRICNLKGDLMLTASSTAFWFNNYDMTNNPAGEDWRALVSGGLCP
jgi:hypothetical protein